MRRLTIVAIAALLSLTACSGDDDKPSANAATWMPAPSASAATPSQPQPGVSTSTPPVTDNTRNGKFTAFAQPCPQGSPLEKPKTTKVSATAECTYGDKSTFPQVKSLATITKPGHPDGTPETVTKDLYKTAVKKAQKKSVEGVATKKTTGLGDEAVIVTSFKNSTATLVVRRGNAVIQASVTIDALGDREQELIQLQQQEPALQALAKALLAELR